MKMREIKKRTAYAGKQKSSSIKISTKILAFFKEFVNIEDHPMLFGLFIGLFIGIVIISLGSYLGRWLAYAGF